jgi:toxin ParE1/3/4
MPNARLPLWSFEADQDLLEIWRYYAEVAAIEIADRLVREMHAAAARAAGKPMVWRARDELIPGLRSIAVRPYAIFYRIAADNIEIVRVLHERRDLAAIFSKPRNPS